MLANFLDGGAFDDSPLNAPLTAQLERTDFDAPIDNSREDGFDAWVDGLLLENAVTTTMHDKVLFSAAHPNPGPFPGGEAWRLLGDAIGAVWAAPTTVVGLGLGTLGYAIDHVFGDGNATISSTGFTLQFGNNPLMLDGTALTLGNVQIFSVEVTGNPDIIAHENAHTGQSNLLGPFYLIVWAGGAMIAGFGGHDPFGEHNPMEHGPYSTPPTSF